MTTGTGLLFPTNGTSGSDIRLKWKGSAFLPRDAHTAIWKAKYVQQTGYYAVTWHTHDIGSWDYGYYSYGAHPYPTTDGTYGANGRALTPTYGSGTNHYYELTGDGGDHISTPNWYLESGESMASLVVTKDIWVTQARTAKLINSGADIEEIYYPDLENNPDFRIRYLKSVSTLYTGPLGTPANPAFYFGASDWSATGSATSESPSCYLRFIKLFSAALTKSEILSEAAVESDSPQTSAGSAAVHYINTNPTVADVTDKSSAGNDPIWANANRPSDFEVEIVVPPSASETGLLKPSTKLLTSSLLSTLSR
jgi:hypothetical protein